MAIYLSPRKRKKRTQLPDDAAKELPVNIKTVGRGFPGGTAEVRNKNDKEWGRANVASPRERCADHATMIQLTGVHLLPLPGGFYVRRCPL